MGTDGPGGRLRGSETEESQRGIRSQDVKCCLDMKDTEGKGSHGLGLGKPLVAFGGLVRAGIERMGFRIRAEFRF